MNKKINIIITVIALLGIILGIAHHIMMKPLNYTYHSEKYGDFYVNSRISNDHTFLIELESVYPVDEWRFNCMLLGSLVIDKDNFRPKLVSKNGANPIMLESNIVANKPLILVLNIRTGVNSAFEYNKVKNSAKKLLDLYDLELPPMLLKEGVEGYDKMHNICNGLK